MDNTPSLFDLLKDYRPTKRNPRGDILQYFAGHTGRSIRFVAVRLSHYSTDELYGLQSAFNDRLGRDGKERALKYWWWCTKTEKVPSE